MRLRTQIKSVLARAIFSPKVLRTDAAYMLQPDSVMKASWQQRKPILLLSAAMSSLPPRRDDGSMREFPFTLASGTSGSAALAHCRAWRFPTQRQLRARAFPVDALRPMAEVWCDDSVAPKDSRHKAAPSLCRTASNSTMSPLAGVYRNKPDYFLDQFCRQRRS